MKKIVICIIFILQFLRIQAYGAEVIKVAKTPHFSADTMGVIISQNSNYLLSIDNIVITVQVSQFDNLPDLLVDNMNVPFNNKGVAVITKMAGSIGIHRIPIVLKTKNEKGEFQISLFNVEYEVGQSWTIIDEGYLNLLYIGVDNPLYISAFRVSEDNIKVKISSSDATIAKSEDGLYIANVHTITDKCYVDVYSNDRIIARKEFRVINPPNPTLCINGKTSGSHLSKYEWTKASVIELSNNDFQFKVNYQVDSFTIKTISATGSAKSFNCDGSIISLQVKEYIAQIPSGSIIIVDNVMVHEKSIGKLRLSPSVYYVD
ncbi:GldM family protein [Flavobacterium filum]|uniref:GldM family protein n=1 Tax=Flavobacterium filum TaxID=370974 RepID=UPI0023F4A083|nr:GldM family protein [Flavobacterium filum]